MTDQCVFTQVTGTCQYFTSAHMRQQEVSGAWSVIPAASEKRGRRHYQQQREAAEQ